MSGLGEDINLQLLIIGGVATYLLYVNMHKTNTVESVTENKVDITSAKKEIKDHVPYVADEMPKPPKMIAISQMQTNIINDKMKYNSKHGWINWDLMHRLGSGNMNNFKTFNFRSNTF